LYNLAIDPLETKNLVGDIGHKSILDSLRKKTDQLGQKYAHPVSDKPTGLPLNTSENQNRYKIIDPKPEFGWQYRQKHNTRKHIRFW
jgi:hypothetical protein